MEMEPQRKRRRVLAPIESEEKRKVKAVKTSLGTKCPETLAILILQFCQLCELCNPF